MISSSKQYVHRSLCASMMLCKWFYHPDLGSFSFSSLEYTEGIRYFNRSTQTKGAQALGSGLCKRPKDYFNCYWRYVNKMQN